MNFGSKIGEQRHGFPLTSMIDLLFILLIFFMTASMYAQFELELNVNLPVATKGQDIEREPSEIIINVLQETRGVPEEEQKIYVVYGNKMSVGEINEKLLRIASDYQGEHIIVRGDEETPWRNIVKVLDACKAANIWNVSFAVRTPEGSPGE
jgi:biopolymer transport protein ExbD